MARFLQTGSSNVARAKKSSAPPAEKLAKLTSRPRSKLTSTILMLVLTDLLLPVLFPPFYCYWLAPFALVPLCVCVIRRPLSAKYLSFYYLAGVGFFLPNLFWLA